MYCGNCGKEVAEGTKFCPNCGAAVNSQPKPADAQSESPATQQEAPAIEQASPVVAQGTVPTGNGDTQTKAEKKGPSKKSLIFLGVAVVIVVAVCAVISMFGGSKTGPDTNIPDWVDKIPVISKGSSMIGSDDVERVKSIATEVTYAEIGDAATALGVPDNDKIKYYKAGGYVGIYNGEIVYFATKIVGDRKDVPLLLYDLPEPLIVKQGSLYVLCYKLENEHNNCYMMLLTTPKDPSTPYLMWAPQFSVDAASAEYCDILNGEMEMEVVSIPDSNDVITSAPESDNTPANTLPPLPDWIDAIPEIPGYASQFDEYPPELFTELGLHSFQDDGLEAELGFSNLDQYSYCTANGTICGVVDNGVTEAYSEIWVGGDPVGMVCQIVLEDAPLIGQSDDGYCFLFYRRDTGYEIYTVTQTDSPNYQDWALKAITYVRDPRCFAYLSGEKPLEIISIPGEGA